MNVLQLNPSLPCIVTSKDNKSALALFLLDYGPAFDLLFVVSMTETGELWTVPTYELKMHTNWTYQRI